MRLIYNEESLIYIKIWNQILWTTISAFNDYSNLFVYHVGFAVKESLIYKDKPLYMETALFKQHTS